MNKRVLAIARKNKEEKDRLLDHFYNDAKASAYHRLGRQYLLQGSVKKCILYYDSLYNQRKFMVDKFNGHYDSLKLAHSLIALGSAHNGEYARKCFGESIEVQLNLRDSSRIPVCYLNIGGEYRADWEKESDSRIKDSLSTLCLINFNNGLRIAQKLKRKREEMYAYSDIGSLKNMIGELDSALYYYGLANDIEEALQNGILRCNTENGIAEVYLKRGDYSRAIPLAERSFERSEQNDFLSGQTKAAEVLYKAWKGMRHFVNALHYLEVRDSLKGIIGNDEVKKALLVQQINFENQVEQEEMQRRAVIDSLQLADAQNEFTSQKKLRKKNNFIIVLLCLGGSLLLVISFFIISRARIIHREKVSLDKGFEELKRFTEDASHELQTPVSLVFSRLDELMQDDSMSLSSRRSVQTIYKETYRVSNLNRSLFLLSKIDNHQFPKDTWVNLDASLKEEVDSFRELMWEKKLHLTTDINVKVRCMTNEFLTSTIISNLLKNSIRHNINGGNVHVELTPDHFFVENNGLDLKKDPELMFDRFKKSSSKKESSGLGLAIVKEACDSLGWSVTYVNIAGRHRLTVNFI